MDAAAELRDVRRTASTDGVAVELQGVPAARQVGQLQHRPGCRIVDAEELARFKLGPASFYGSPALFCRRSPLGHHDVDREIQVEHDRGALAEPVLLAEFL